MNHSMLGRMPGTILSVLFLAGGGAWPRPCAAAEEVAAPLPEVVGFNRDIRALLSENCSGCHGPDSNKRKANLRLDTQAGLFG